MNIKPVVFRLDIVSRTLSDQKELVRVVKTSDNKVVIEKDEKILGRGAYLKLDRHSIQTAQKRHLLEKALRCNVGNEVYEELLKLIKE